VSKRKKEYDPKALYLQGLLAFGRFFSNLKWEHSHLTKKQQRARRAFKRQRIARRAQRLLEAR